jgi:hypothetical protein
MTFDEERPIGTRAKHPVEELRETRWWSATVFRHQVHIQTCKKLNCEDLIQPFFRFADEVMSSPEAARDDMLAVEGLEPYVAFQRYPAYIEPTKDEQKLDFYSASMGRKLR